MKSSYREVTATWWLTSGGGLELARLVKVLARSISALRSPCSSVSVTGLESAQEKSGVADLTLGALVSWFPLYEVVHLLLGYPASTFQHPDLPPSALLLQSPGVGEGKNRCRGM